MGIALELTPRFPGVDPLLYLRLLGGLSIEEDGVVVSGRAAQKRRLALLALLAADPHRTVSRDKLMGLLWPDKNAEQARHVLSVAIYEIRKELGEDLVQSRGDDLALDPTRLTSDLDGLRLALDEGDLGRVTALYVGPFLDGFFLGGSAEFDDWVEQERAALARAVNGAIEDLAERCEAAGDTSGAVAAWRQLAAGDRYDSRIALRLLAALAADGNRTGALQFARVHEALLQDEFQTEPAAEFTALVESIRTAPASATSPSTTIPALTPAPSTTPPVPASSETSDPVAATTAVVGQRPGRRRRAWRRLAGRAGHGYLRTGIVMVLFLVAVGFGAYLQRRVVPEAPPGTSVAVLPFTHGGGADEAFGDGLAEEILGLLGTVSGVRTPVWSASASLRGLSAQEAARRLGVDHVLDGSVREDEGRLRIRVSLSDAAGMSRWSNRYDVLQGDVFRTQEEIARAVLRALEVELSGDAVVARQGGTEDFPALTYYQKGRHAWYKRTPDGFRQAVAYFGSAVEQDPEYARAYAGLADTYSLMGAYDYGLMPPDSAHELARAAARTALRLAPELAEAHAAMAQVRFAYGRDWAGADEAYRKAIELNPRYAEAHQWYSLYLVAVGRPEEAMAAARRALALDTVSPVMHSNMGRHLYYRQDYEAAREAFHRALSIDQGFIYAHLGLGQVLLQLDPAEAVTRFTHALELIGQPHPLTLALLGNALGRAGRPDDARGILQRLEAIRAAGVFVPPEYPAIVHAGLGQFDETVAAFEAAYHGGSSSVSVLAVDPLALSLRGHAGFERLLGMAAPPGALR